MDQIPEEGRTTRREEEKKENVQGRIKQRGEDSERQGNIIAILSTIVNYLILWTILIQVVLFLFLTLFLF